MHYGTTHRTMTVLGVATAAIALGAAPAHATGTDTTPPSTPTNVHQVGADLSWSQSSIAWNASADDGTVSYYWVKNVTYGNRVKPRATSTALGNLFLPFCAVPTGITVQVTVQAVDAAGNKSAPSAPITVRVN